MTARARRVSWTGVVAMRRPQRALGSMGKMHALERSQVGDRFDRLPGRLLGISDVETWCSSRSRY